MRRGTLPLGDFDALRPLARRTALLRWSLAVAALGACGLAYLLAPRGDVAHASAAGGPGSVVVLDVSGSITDRGSAQIQRALADEIRDAGPGGRVGLVLFSDVAMETLPPTAPAGALQQFRRFFIRIRKPPRRSDGSAAAAVAAAGVGMPTGNYRWSPWGIAFSGGTKVSAGLREARDALRRAGMDGGTVLLLSDLVDSPDDMPALRRELQTYARDPSLDLQVRALASTYEQPIGLFRSVLGRDAVAAAQAGPPPPLGHAAHYPLPVWLLAVALAAALALSAAELWVAPLRWGERAEAGS